MREQHSILIVDDEQSARDTLGALLAKEDFALIFAADGEEALGYLRMTPPDVVLLDVMMPRMDGFDVCRRIKEDAALRHIPVIMVTALDSRDFLERGLECGADDFLSKPVNGSELRARVRSMLRIKSQYDDLARMLALRDELALLIVHDLRNPLLNIMLQVQLLLIQHTGNPELTQSLELIQAESQRLHTLSNEILMISKMEQGKLLLNRTETDLAAMLRDVAEANLPLARAGAVTVAIDVPEEEIPARMMDRMLVRRVIENLLSNALKFSPRGGTVVLRLRAAKDAPDGGKIRLEVSDDGPGVPPEDRGRIFEKYEIAPLKFSGFEQTGLGLYFCRLVADAHGGTIRVEPNTGGGARFIVEL